MSEPHALTDLLIIFSISVCVVLVFQRLRLPSIAGFLTAGALVGPYGLNLVSDLQQVQAMAGIGVVLLLFTIGIEFSLAQLAANRRLFLVAGPIQVLVTLALSAMVAKSLGLSLPEAIFWGFLISLSSTAIVLKTLGDRGESDSLYGRATIGVLVFQDLAAVPMMLVIPLMEEGTSPPLQDLVFTLVKSLVVVALVVVTARFFVPRLLAQIVSSRSRELFLLTVIVLCLGIAWVTSFSGLSLALGAFIAGLIISESEYCHQALAEILPFRDSLNSLFFVSVGMLMDVRVMWNYPWWTLGIVVAVLLGKSVMSVTAFLGSGYPPRVALLSGVALAQVGEFSFILAQQGQAAGLFMREGYQLFLAVSVLTMVATPFLIQWAPRLARRAEAFQRLHHWLPDRTVAHVAHSESPNLKIRDHVIVIGYGLNGKNLARVLRETEIPYLALELDHEIVQRESKRGVPIYYGDGTNPHVLRHMRIDDARVVVVALSDPFAARKTVQIAKGLNPAIHIIVRTRYLRELEELHQLGADEVVPEEFETSIEIFSLVLRSYKMPQEFIIRKSEQIRKEGYEVLRRTVLPELAHHLRGGVPADAAVESFRLDSDSPAIGKTVAQLSLRPMTGASIIALTRDGVTQSNPSVQLRLQVGDVVVLMGTRDQMRKATALLLDLSNLES